MTIAAKKNKVALPKRTKPSGRVGAKRKPKEQVRATNKKAVSKAKQSPRTPKPPNSNGISKAGEIIRLLQRKSGASIVEIQDATGWQAHSVRGFLSGTVKKRMGHDLRSEKASDGLRRYMIGAR